jgi:DNA-binding PadR family transcriptional regulator
MSRDRPDPSRYLPLRPDVFAILLILLDGDAHGYAILKASADRGDGRGPLQPGVLYRFLRQMREEGLVSEVGAPSGSARQDERRRYYRVTPLGRQVARAEAQRMASLLNRSRHHRLLAD